MKIGVLFYKLAGYLSGKGIAYSEEEAAFLISHAVNIKKNELSLHKEDPVAFSAFLKVLSWGLQRGRHKPAAMILKKKWFYNDEFLVGPGTLIPRADTEHILYEITRSGGNYKKILDIGTGSGALAVSLSRLFPLSAIDALDIRTGPARRNIRKFGIRNIRLVRADFFRWKADPSARYDLIVSNPPYLSRRDMENLDRGARNFEPVRAFYGGQDGLDFYRKIAAFSSQHLEKTGMLAVETDYKWEKVKEIFESAGFPGMKIGSDYNGLERVLSWRL